MFEGQLSNAWEQADAIATALANAHQAEQRGDDDALAQLLERARLHALAVINLIGRIERARERVA